VKKILLGLLGFILLVIVVALVVLQVKFGAIIGSPRVPYTTLMGQEARVQFVLDIPKAKDIVRKKLLGDAKIPEALFVRSLPYEMASWVETNSATGEMKASVFMNDQRLAPVLIQQINAMDISKMTAKMFTWDEMKLKRVKPGVMLMEGIGKVDADVRGIINERWTKKDALAPLTAEGGHLVEVVLDNRDGGALGILASMVAANGMPLDRLKSKSAMDIVAGMSDLRFSIDLVSEDVADLVLTINFTPETEKVQVQAMKQLLDMGLSAGKGFVKGGLKLDGSSKLDGDFKYVAAYKLEGVKSLVAML
jgi:hypothetical protein